MFQLSILSFCSVPVTILILFLFIQHDSLCLIIGMYLIWLDLNLSLLLVFFLFFSFYGHTCGTWKFPGSEVESELQLPAYTTTIATPVLSCNCNLCCILPKCWILNLLSKARNWTHIFMDRHYFQFLTHWITTGIPSCFLFAVSVLFPFFNFPCLFVNWVFFMIQFSLF